MSSSHSLTWSRYLSLLQFVLVTLNMLLGYCAIVGTFRPHFEVLFAMSLGLSGCYIWYVDCCFLVGRNFCLSRGLTFGIFASRVHQAHVRDDEAAAEKDRTREKRVDDELFLLVPYRIQNELFIIGVQRHRVACQNYFLNCK